MKKQDNKLIKSLNGILVSAFVPFALLGADTTVNAADYAPATPPPAVTPSIVKQAPMAAQPGIPEKWI